MTPLADLPLVDETRCTGCGDCPRVCPANCLAMAGPLPWLPRPADCISCGLCVWICPAQAVRIPLGNLPEVRAVAPPSPG